MDTVASGNGAVLNELERVLSSSTFRRSGRQSHFLRFAVERSLDGREDELKESVIAVEVFGREPDFDPKADGIVRTEAMRLRSRLDRYYSSEGTDDPVVIELPKGGYRPVFRERRTAQEAEPVPENRSRRRIWIWAAVGAVVLVACSTWWGARAGSPNFTIAVVPLENLSNDAARDYLADGLTDEIVRDLAEIDGLTVRSRASSFALKGKRLPTAELGKELAADYLVGGSVLHTGDHLRVNVELTRVRDAVSLWSGRYDRKVTDVVAIQDEISGGIVNTLRLKLTPGRRRYESNIEAYDLYLRGRQEMSSFPGPGNGRTPGLQALKYFETAIEKDPNYAIAYAGLADAYFAIADNLNAPEAFARAKTAADRAVELDPMASEAHSARASILAAEYRWPEAEQEFRTAIDLNPNNALAHLQFGASVLVIQERIEEGLAEVRRGVELEPLSPFANTEFGRALLFARRYEEAADQYRKAIALDPSRTQPYVFLARALYLQGRTDEALTMFAEAKSRGSPVNGVWPDCAMAMAGRETSVSEAAMSPPKQDLPFPPAREGRPDRRMAMLSACRKDQDHALEFLEKAVAQRMLGLAVTVQAPEMQWLRSSPRFAALRKQIGLHP